MNKIILIKACRNSILTLAALSITSCLSCISLPSSSSKTAFLKVISSAPQSLNHDLLGYDLIPSDTSGSGLGLILEKQTGNIQKETMTYLAGIKIPLLLFPGGSDSEPLDWRDFINNAPGKARFRPLKIKTADGTTIDTRFGIDEFLRLKRGLNCKAVVTVNLIDGLARKRSVRESAELAAGLVAYCNADSGAHIPESYSHWPSIRARNGSPMPLKAEYVQLGFEPSSADCIKMVKDSVPHLNGDALVRWYIDGLSVYIERIRKADPDIKIMLDGAIGGELSASIFKNTYIRDNVDIIGCHKPGSSTGDSAEQSRFAAALQLAKNTGKRAACMSWSVSHTGSQSDAAIDCALWLNSMIRNSDLIETASFDSLLGKGNEISALIISNTPNITPRLSSTGEVIALYSRCHGNTSYPVLNPEISNPDSVVAGIDIAVTSTQNTLFIHAVNSNVEGSIRVDLDCAGFNLNERVEMISLESKPDHEQIQEPADRQPAQNFKHVKYRKERVIFEIPPRTVSILIATRSPVSESN